MKTRTEADRINELDVEIRDLGVALAGAVLDQEIDAAASPS